MPNSFFLKQQVSHNPGISEPSACLLCDDNVGNIEAAKAFGWQTVLVVSGQN
jgi:HAD superfamily hydrolase (TIGR01509 family)